MPADIRNSGDSLNYRVALILLLQASQELKKSGSPLANEIEQFVEGVVKEREENGR
jgi:hypothetical protein